MRHKNQQKATEGMVGGSWYTQDKISHFYLNILFYFGIKKKYSTILLLYFYYFILTVLLQKSYLDWLIDWLLFFYNKFNFADNTKTNIFIKKCVPCTKAQSKNFSFPPFCFFPPFNFFLCTGTLCIFYLYFSL